MFLPFIPFLSGIAFVQDGGIFELTSQINKINIYNFRRKKYTLSIKDKSGNDIKMSESQMIKIMSILERG